MVLSQEEHFNAFWRVVCHDKTLQKQWLPAEAFVQRLEEDGEYTVRQLNMILGRRLNFCDGTATVNAHGLKFYVSTNQKWIMKQDKDSTNKRKGHSATFYYIGKRPKKKAPQETLPYQEGWDSFECAATPSRQSPSKKPRRSERVDHAGTIEGGTQDSTSNIGRANITTEHDDTTQTPNSIVARTTRSKTRRHLPLPLPLATPNTIVPSTPDDVTPMSPEIVVR